MAQLARRETSQNAPRRANGKLCWLGCFVASASVLMLATESPGQPPGGPGRGGPRAQGGPSGPEGPPPERRGRSGERDGRQHGAHGRPPMPLMEALDADADGTISASEIANAANALKTLDQNSDGSLSGDEVRPKFGGRERGDRQAAGGERGRTSFAERLMRRDKDGDGELSEEEVPKRMQEHFSKIDEDQSGSISLAELQAKAPGRGPQARGPGDPNGRGDRPDRSDRRRGPGGPPSREFDNLESL